MSINNNEPQANPTPSLQSQAETHLSRGFDDAALYAEWQTERREWITLEVTKVLNRISPVIKREGRFKWRHCPNPAHIGGHSSFRISYDVDFVVGVPQCSCGIQHENHPWDLVAEWVGAAPFIEWWKDISLAYMELENIRQNVSEMPTEDETTSKST